MQFKAYSLSQPYWGSFWKPRFHRLRQARPFAGVAPLLGLQVEDLSPSRLLGKAGMSYRADDGDCVGTTVGMPSFIPY